MKKSIIKPFIVFGGLVALTCGALFFTRGQATLAAQPTPTPQIKTGVVGVAAGLTRTKVPLGGDGVTALSLTLRADDVIRPDQGTARPVDMVIVLDRSGSMEGKKIEDARRAILNLLSNLSDKDRFALVSYSNGVRRHSNLLSPSAGNLQALNAAVRQISAGGGTNLGEGLREGIAVLLGSERGGRLGRVILISDGLANQGVTNPADLGKMASIAVKQEFSISTVGVGLDFNENLMTRIADRGTGTYHYLENPDAFARVFQQEMMSTRTAVATGVEVRIPLKDGVSVVDAAGYPVEVVNGEAVFYPGDLRSGQTRKLFVTLRMPTDKEAAYDLTGVKVKYLHDGTPYTMVLPHTFQVACVKDRKAVMASYDKKEWEKKVLQEDYHKLQEEVARDIKLGRKKEAVKRIDDYRVRQQSVNAVLGSEKVDSNLKKDLKELEGLVEDSFEGSADEVRMKQKTRSKALQHKGYGMRRSLQ